MPRPARAAELAVLGARARAIPSVDPIVDLNDFGQQSRAQPMQDACFAYEGLQRAFHEKARLGIMSALVARPDGVPFGELKRLCALTSDGRRHFLAYLGELRRVLQAAMPKAARKPGRAKDVPAGFKRSP